MKFLKGFSTALKKIISASASVVITAVMCSVFPVYSSAVNEVDYQSYTDEIVILVNEARIEAGLNPLYAVPVLNEVSNLRAYESVEVFSHYRPDSTLFNTALDDYSVPYGAAAENIAAGLSTAEATFNQWKNSSGHWRNIMNENYTHIGVGVCYDNDSVYGWYWEQIFISNSFDLEGQYLPERYTVVPACCGDIDGDGAITSLDLILMRKLLNKDIILNDLQKKSADCMGDGVLTIADMIVLQKYMLGMYSSLPVLP